MVTDPHAPKPALRAIAYGPEEVVDLTLDSPAAVRPLLAKHRVLWLNVDGLGDAQVLAQIGEIFGLHRLALEDVLSGHQRAKVEDYGTHVFIVARMPEVEPGDERIETDQLSLFLGTAFVVTFQERAGDCFQPIRDRLRSKDSRLRTHGPDYLAYSLLDSVIDSYFPLLERVGEELEILEEEVLLRPATAHVKRIHGVKRKLLTLRRAVWPQREAASALLREHGALFGADTRVYLADCYDHTVQIMDLLETYRELASGLMEVYLSSISNRMNEIMKVLTVITTLFIPLTFIVGVYGMNFDFMPELHSRWGYPLVLGLMVVVALGLLYFFKRKGWIGDTSARAPETDESSRSTS